MLKRNVWFVALSALVIAALACGGAGGDTDPTPKPTKETTSDNGGDADPTPKPTKDSGDATDPEPTEEGGDDDGGDDGGESGGLPEPQTGDGFADPDEIEVIGGEWWVGDDGFFHAWGMVVNNTDSAISGQLAFVYLDENGEAITSEDFEGTANYDVTSFYAPIAPGETGYFIHIRDLARVNGEIDEVELGLSYALLEPVTPIAEFSDVNFELAEDGSTLLLTGAVENSGDTACNLAAVGVAYTSDDEVVWVHDSTAFLEDDPDAEQILEAGEAVEFELTYYFFENVEEGDFDGVVPFIDCSNTSFPRD